jgi:hypothetical protein
MSTRTMAKGFFPCEKLISDQLITVQGGVNYLTALGPPVQLKTKPA